MTETMAMPPMPRMPPVPPELAPVRRIIGLSGYPNVGKDTVAKMLVPRGYQRVAFADPIRALALDLDAATHSQVSLYGWEKAKENGYVRRYLQKLGQMVRHHIHPDVWLDLALSKMVEDGNYVVTDVRYKNEAQAVAMFGGKVVRVERPEHGAVNDHSSETDMDSYPYDAVLVNDGDLTQLFDKVMALEEQLFS